MASKAQIAANIKYNKSRDTITIRPDKDTGAAIRAAAEESGLSIQRYILQAIQERMEREGGQNCGDNKIGIARFAGLAQMPKVDGKTAGE